MKRLITLLAVAGLVLALAPAAVADTPLYTEDFIDAVVGHGQPLGDSNTGWEGRGAWGDPYVGPHVHQTNSLGGSYPNTPDGDGYHVQNHTGQSNSKYAVSKAGEYTIIDPATLVCDWAANGTKGMRFLAEVDGTWYGSAQLGTNSDDHGAMDGNGVTEWEVDVSVNTATNNWYLATGLPDGYDWRDGTRFSTTPLMGLPTGDIARFGIGWLNTGNNDYGAVDNFRILASGGDAPGTLIIVR